MHCPVLLAVGLLVTVFGTATSSEVHAQLASAPFPTWTGEHPARNVSQAPAPHRSSVLPLGEAATRSQTGSGLLIGGLVGAAATTLFLVGFCGDPDTACGGDEVGRAVLVIAVPCAAAGALIGSLIHTDR